MNKSATRFLTNKKWQKCSTRQSIKYENEYYNKRHNTSKKAGL